MEKQNGCDHYQRNCLIAAPCCQKYYPCKLCHDQKYQGPKADWCKVERMDFSAVNKIKCIACEKQQQPSQKCIECDVKFGQFVCLKCKLYENNPNKIDDIFHCDECRMCRRGKRQNFFHCDNCGYCRAISQKNKHKCTQNIADSKCPICLDVLKYSTKYYHAMKCGHLIHVQCLQGYKNINCPVCGMALFKLSKHQNQNIQKAVQQTRANLPQEMKNAKVSILCNQCLHKTIDAPFHYYGIKCQKCGTFNTKLISNGSANKEAEKK